MEVTVYDYPIEFVKELVLQYPVQQIADFVKKHRSGESALVIAEVKKVINENETEIKEMCKDITKFMDYDMNLLSPKEFEIDAFKDRLTYIKKRLRRTNEFLENRDITDKQRIFLPFIKEEINNLEKFKEPFFKKVDSKQIWTENDVTIHSYYLLYLELLKAIYALLSRQKQTEMERALNQVSYMLFVYKPILIAYVTGDLPNKLLLKKLAEVRCLLMPTSTAFPNMKLKPLYDELFNIPPIKDS